VTAFATKDILAAGIGGKRQKETKNIQTAIQSVLCTGSAWREKVREKKKRVITSRPRVGAHIAAFLKYEL